MLRRFLSVSLLAGAAFLATFGAAPSAHAQDYPNRAIKLIVPFPPGGPNDITARPIAQKMQEILGQPVVIDNRAGAGGVTGMDAVAKSDPDGYTIGIASAGPLTIGASLLKSIPFDYTKDLAPIALCVKFPEILVVAPNVPAKTLPELIALAKANPGKLNFASTGIGGTPHLAGELFKIKAGINIVHIPYRGAAQAVTDLLGNQVQLMFADIPVLLPHVKAGALGGIATASKDRAPTLPDLKTLGEQGLAGVEADNWYGLFAPAGTPPAIIAKLNSAANQAVQSADVKSKLEPLGVLMAGSTPDEFKTHLAADRIKWADIIKAAGVKIDE